MGGTQPVQQKSHHAKIFVIKNHFDVRFGNSTKLSDNLCGVVNGPLVHKDKNFVGGIIEHNTQLKKWVEPKIYDGNFAYNTGIFGCSESGKMFLKNSSENSSVKPEDTEWAFQNGPILLDDGVNTHNPKNPKRCYRSGIGFNEKEELVVIVSEDKVNMFEFSELFRENGCKDAIYLDGEQTQKDNDYVGYNINGQQEGMASSRKVLQFFNTEIQAKKQ